MAVAHFVYELEARGIKLNVVDDKLKTAAKKGAISQDEANFIRSHKSDIISYLNLRQRFSLGNLSLQPASIHDSDAQQGTVIAPLSFAQQRLWYFYERDKSDCSYNICQAVRLASHTSLENVQATFNQLLTKHAILRTVYKVVDDQPQQHTLPEFTIKLEKERFQEEQLNSILEQEWNTPFDLENHPPVRVRTLENKKGQVWLIYSFHHIAVDGYSAEIFFADFAKMYQNLCHGDSQALTQSDRLKAPTLQYSDFALWEKQQEKAGLFDFQLDFWKQQLASSPSVPASFSQKPVCDQDMVCGKEYKVELAPALHAQIKRTAISHNMTPFMVTLSALYVLLHRYSGQEDLIVGTAHANRVTEELEQVVGFFVNMLPIRLDLSNIANNAELLRAVRKSVTASFDHHLAPFERVVQQAKGARHSALNPLFHVSIAYQNANDKGAEEKQAGISDFEVVPGDSEQLRFPIQFTFYPRGEKLSLVVEYSQSLFPERLIVQLVRGLQLAITDICQNQQGLVSQVPVAEPDMSGITAGVHLKRKAQFAPDTIVSRVEKAIAQYPNRVAVADDEQQITYAQLALQVDQLCAELLASGIVATGENPDSKIAIALPRHCQLVVAILASLKLGCTYVPIDPQIPIERRDYILEDAQPAALVTLSGLPQAINIPTICLDSLDEKAAAVEDELLRKTLLQCQPSPQSGAYIIYTSGSTGKPKGVVVSHHNVTRLFDSAQAHYDFSEQDTWSLFHSYGFDFSVWEMFGALFYGGKVQLVPMNVAKNAEAFIGFIIENGITVLNQTPSAFRQLVNVISNQQMTALPLRHVIFGGEKLEPAVVESWYDKKPSCGIVLHNMFGITETTVHVTHQIIDQKNKFNASVVGEPLSDLEILLLDKNMKPVPPYAVGEAWVGGAGVTGGYLNKPEQTAQRFIKASEVFSQEQIPHQQCQSEVLYRTGDLMTWDPGKGLIYCRRNDNQVQLRGYRVELDEIGQAIRECDGVEDTEVRIWNRAEDDAVVAYIIAKQEEMYQSNDEHQNMMSSLFDYAYGSAQNIEEFKGWTSSVDDQLIPQQEMRIWADNTVQRVMRSKPSSILELGCGTGILATRYAKHIRRYVGLDFSEQSVLITRKRLDAFAELSKEVHQKNIISFPEVTRGETFDCIVINSVIQYLPHQDNVRQVIEQCIAALNKGGVLFVGDILDWTRQDEYNQWLKHKRIAKGLSTEIDLSKELKFAPAYFTGLAQQLGFEYCLIQPKSELTDNEMSRFRFDAVLMKEAKTHKSIDWKSLKGDQSPQQLTEFLTSLGGEEQVLWQGVQHPNCVSTSDQTLVDNLQSCLDVLSTLGWHYEPFLPDTSDAAALHLRLHKGTADSLPDSLCTQHVTVQGQSLCSTITARKDLIAVHVLTELKQSLPDYMVPAYIEVLESWPVTANGKLDEDALPIPDVSDNEDSQVMTATERTLHDIWCKYLGLEKIGVHKKFFEVGGHSLLVIRVAADIERAFGVDIGAHGIFSLATISAISAEIDNLRSDSVSRIGKAEPAGDYPLSFAQQRLWVVDQHMEDDKSAMYNMPSAFEIPDSFNLSALQQALQMLVDKHSILRTYFVLTMRGPRQVVANSLRVNFDIVMVQSVAQIKDMIAARIAKPFDLSRVPLFNVSLMQIPATHNKQGSYVVLLNMHHIITDGWSLQLLQQEWLENYNQLLHTEQKDVAFPQKSPSLDLEYLDYAVWQNSGDLQQHWQELLPKAKKTFANIARLHSIETDFPRPQSPTGEGKVIVQQVPVSISEKLPALCQELDISPLQLFFGVFSLLMRSANKGQSLTIGMPATERERAGLENTQGYFVNSLPVACTQRLTDNVAQWLRDSKRSVLDALQRNSLPFDWLVDQLDVERMTNAHPMFQILFSWQQADDNLKLAESLGVKGVGIPWSFAKFDLNLEVIQEAKQKNKDNKFWCKWEYSTELFSQATIEAWHKDTIHILSLMCDAETLAMPVIDVIPNKNQFSLAIADRTGKLQPLSAYVYFMEQVQQVPQSTALVICDEHVDSHSQNRREISYQAFHAQVELLAAHLQQQGVSEGDTLVFCLKNRYQGICLMFACMRLGATFSPVDASWNEQRLQQINQQIKPALLVTENSLQALGCWDPKSNGPVAISTDALTEVKNHYESPVSCMFTSGTTGVPKGVLVKHSGIVRLVKNSDITPLNHDSRILQYSSLGFDAATFEVFGALLNGGTLVVAGAGDNYFESIDNLLTSEKINTAWMTAGFFEHWTNLTQEPGHLQYLLVGGDVVSPLAVQRLYERNDSVSIINGYGPTENTTFSTTYPIPRDWDISQPLPIGYCVKGSSCIVVDDNFQLLPAGSKGQLLVGGFGVAQGYYNDTQRTDEKFIQVDGLQDTYYVTGDRVLMQENGCLEFFGRTDNLVKVNGFRIELGEIETSLTQIDGIDVAAALVLGKESGEKVLAAAIQCSTDELSDDVILTQLAQTLPPYMLPGSLRRYDALPINQNGKFDRKQLRLDMEEALSVPAIWQDAEDTKHENEMVNSLLTMLRKLGVEGIDPEKNFFSQKGNSLLAIRFINIINSELNLNLAVSALYRHQTLTSLATYLTLLTLNEAPSEQAFSQGHGSDEEQIDIVL